MSSLARRGDLGLVGVGAEKLSAEDLATAMKDEDDPVLYTKSTYYSPKEI
jgi:hypothetical protein